MSNLLKDASILLTPTGYDNGSMNAIKPENGDGDFTFSRNSAATRVNAQGLVENVQILSGNLVSNGDFANGTTGWITTNGSITVTNGEATILGNSANGGVYQSLAQAGVTYFVEIEVLSINSGNWYAGGYITNTYSIDNTGKISFYYTSTGTGFHILSSGGAGSITIGNVSVKQVDPNDRWSTAGTVNGSNYVEYSSGGARLVTDGTGTGISQSMMVVGTTYELTFDVIDATLGSAKFDGAGISFSSVGSYSTTFTAPQTALTYYRNSGAADITIDNVTLKEYAAMPLDV